MTRTITTLYANINKVTEVDYCLMLFFHVLPYNVLFKCALGRSSVAVDNCGFCSNNNYEVCDTDVTMGSYGIKKKNKKENPNVVYVRRVHLRSRGLLLLLLLHLLLLRWVRWPRRINGVLPPSTVYYSSVCELRIFPYTV